MATPGTRTSLTRELAQDHVTPLRLADSYPGLGSVPRPHGSFPRWLRPGGRPPEKAALECLGVLDAVSGLLHGAQHEAGCGSLVIDVSRGERLECDVAQAAFLIVQLMLLTWVGVLRRDLGEQYEISISSLARLVRRHSLHRRRRRDFTSWPPATGTDSWQSLN